MLHDLIIHTIMHGNRYYLCVKNENVIHILQTQLSKQV
jgi:hypothetical protein